VTATFVVSIATFDEASTSCAVVSLDIDLTRFDGSGCKLFQM
jgi:hypothetical protein